MERNRWFALAATLCVLALAVFVAANPPAPGAYLPCGFHAITGLYCPGCGGTRAAHSILHGDFETALHQNAFVVASLPLAVIYFFAACRYVATGKWFVPFKPRTKLVVAALILILAFGVLRNLPWFAILAPTPVPT